ncbi:hypothetical protein [Streptomyces sp. NPDC029554]|uniref:hypothetical protein n=1 Tax=Streptomyces sp. NPDC029554 TaxID=3155126 RepID=UPI00340EE9E6
MSRRTAETTHLHDAGGQLLIRRARGDGDTVLYLGATEVWPTVKTSPARADAANGQNIARAVCKFR